MEKYKVRRVSEFVKLLEDIGINKYIYRGQNEPYSGIQASGFRKYKDIENNGNILDINYLYKQFYDEVASKLTSGEKDHFLSFCQHYGLPTNLVDFTYSPLVALFFSCYGKQKPSFSYDELFNVEWDKLQTDIQNDDRLKNAIIGNIIKKLSNKDYSHSAQVFLIKKSRLLDISDIVNSLNDNFYLDLVLANKLQNFVSDKFINVAVENADKFAEWLVNIIDCYKINGADIYGILDGEDLYERGEEDDEEDPNIENIFTFQERLKNDSLQNVIIDLYWYVHHHIEDETIVFGIGFDYDIALNDINQYPIEIVASKTYLLLLVNLMDMFQKNSRKMSLSTDVYFSYQPPKLFDRISNQKGLFIYQMYTYLPNGVAKSDVLNVQNISPDIVIEIDNYKSILNELNNLGINLEGIYGDFDNIAKSVVFTYEDTLNRTDNIK